MDSPRIDDQWLASALERYAAERSVTLRDQIQSHADWLAVRTARRFADSGEPFDDLVQVARLGLFKAIERYDPTHGVPFLGFATPTILGELRRHFRDHTWSVHVPRRAKDLRPLVNGAVQELTAELGRSPKVDEIARRLRLSEEAVLEALEANNAYRSSTLDAALSSHVAVADKGHEDVVDRALVVSLLDRLPERERKVLYLRFYDELSQSQIAERIGVSQVHVSRILSASLQRLRSFVERDAAPAT